MTDNEELLNEQAKLVAEEAKSVSADILRLNHDSEWPVFGFALADATANYILQYARPGYESTMLMGWMSTVL